MLAWWNEELQGWAIGARRHPLGAVLQPLSAPWTPLAASLLSLQASRERPPGTDPEPAGVTLFSRAAADCESALFDADAPAEGGAKGAEQVAFRSVEYPYEIQSLTTISYAVLRLNKKNITNKSNNRSLKN